MNLCLDDCEEIEINNRFEFLLCRLILKNYHKNTKDCNIFSYYFIKVYDGDIKVTHPLRIILVDQKNKYGIDAMINGIDAMIRSAYNPSMLISDLSQRCKKLRLEVLHTT
jgi:hypothetical protein